MDVEKQVQKLIEDFNDLVEEGRYPEAEVLARQAVALAPDIPEVVQLEWQAKFLRRVAESKANRDMKENSTWETLEDVNRAATPFSDREPYRFGDADRWADLSESRRTAMESRSYRSQAERRIWDTLQRQEYQGSFNNRPLSEVCETLAQVAGVNIIFDQPSLDAERVTTDRPITKNFSSPVSLGSALKLVLADAGLIFVVEDEVIKVTNSDYRRRDVEVRRYYVGDLIHPIPNFSSPLSMNFLSPFSPNAMSGSTMGAANRMSGDIPLQMGAQMQPGATSQLAMAQQLPGSPVGGMPFGSGLGSGNVQRGTPSYAQVGPPELGGITAADFTDLIDLIQNSIEPTSWEDDNTAIRPYANVLSLIVTQTQDVHDQIQDLLEKLRDLNDVQIVIEVRFITLQDNFFERIGIDFDFQINENSTLTPGQIPDNVNGSQVVGVDPTGNPTADLDLNFVQDTFTSAIPQFGGFDAGTAANFGFAILSDIEVFFLIQASKGDTRSNALQAPTVTLFNGQVGQVTDGSTRPFVTSVIPVVGDFAAAQQPIITLLPEGSFLNVQATASQDRRFVTMTLVPFFSQVTAVDTFSFQSTRRAGSSTGDDVDADNDNANNGNSDDDLIEATTVQLPTLTFTTVNTTVSVPDGGTVLLGGIKRLSEGRNERGVPFLSNVPYVSRLFKNVGIGRDTESLMMMVTPRIIIQKEEEKRQVGDVGGG